MKILIVQTGRIGDMILTTPMFRALKEKLPAATLHVLTSPRGQPVIVHNPHIDKIIVRGKGIMGWVRTVRSVRKEEYDVWIDPKDHGSSESSMLADYSGAKKKIGFNKEGKHVFGTVIPSDKENFLLHAVQRNLNALIPLGILPGPSLKPELFIDKKIEEAVRMAAGGNKDLVVVNISAGQPTRTWTEEGWRKVIRFCLERTYRIALTFQPDDARRAVQLRNEFPGITVLPSPTIEHAAALVALASLVVTADTSIVHIASAYDIPIIALYPSVDWNYNKFRPLSTKQETIMSPESNSLMSIPAETVLEKIAALMT